MIKPLSPAELVDTCQHLRIDNTTGCCARCSEQMVAWTIETKTVLSALNVNPCTNPEHLDAIAAGEHLECDAVYMPGPARAVVIGYDGTVFVPDCGHSHRGDFRGQG